MFRSGVWGSFQNPSACASWSSRSWILRWGYQFVEESSWILKICWKIIESVLLWNVSHIAGCITAPHIMDLCSQCSFHEMWCLCSTAHCDSIFTFIGPPDLFVKWWCRMMTLPWRPSMFRVTEHFNSEPQLQIFLRVFWSPTWISSLFCSTLVRTHFLMETWNTLLCFYSLLLLCASIVFISRVLLLWGGNSYWLLGLD